MYKINVIVNFYLVSLLVRFMIWRWVPENCLSVSLDAETISLSVVIFGPYLAAKIAMWYKRESGREREREMKRNRKHFLAELYLDLVKALLLVWLDHNSTIRWNTLHCWSYRQANKPPEKKSFISNQAIADYADWNIKWKQIPTWKRTFH